MGMFSDDSCIIPRGPQPRRRPFHTNSHGDYSLNANEQREFAARMERKQMKEFMTVSSWQRFPIDLPLRIVLGRPSMLGGP